MTGVALKAGVIGWPIKHSLSPHLHGFWLEQYKIDGEYLPFAVAPGELESFLRGLGERDRRGTNITLPHKQAALAIVDEIDDNARRIGAVNTVTRLGDGRLQGSNTDGFGFLENLKNQQPAWQATGGPAVVLGAGGAARAILVALQDAGAPEIILLNRTQARADTLCQELGGVIKVRAWEERAAVLSAAATLVNTTSLGMIGQDPLQIDLSHLPIKALVTDIVYTPLETALLKNAKVRGNPTVDGLGMLLHQARPGFAAWFGVTPEVTPALRAHMLAVMKN